MTAEIGLRITLKSLRNVNFETSDKQAPSPRRTQSAFEPKPRETMPRGSKAQQQSPETTIEPCEHAYFERATASLRGRERIDARGIESLKMTKP